MEESKNKVLEELGIYNPGEEPKVKSKNSGTNKKNYLLPLILILALVGAIGYIGYDKFQENVEVRETEIFQQGARYATNQITLALFDEALACNIIPINNGSLEITLIATRCLTAPSP